MVQEHMSRKIPTGGLQPDRATSIRQGHDWQSDLVAYVNGGTHSSQAIQKYFTHKHETDRSRQTETQADKQEGRELIH